jgi:hypothetical protein
LIACLAILSSCDEMSAVQAIDEDEVLTARPVSRTSSISRHGITWTFASEHESGRFANGDWWVVGPITVVSVSPAPSGRTNGSMVNPPFGEQSFDGRSHEGKSIGHYTPSVEFPLVLEPNQSLVSTASVGDPGVSSTPIFIRDAAVLTAVAEPPPADAFRPPYVGDDKPYYRVAQLRRDLLPGVPGVEDMQPIDEVEDSVERIWLDNVASNNSRFMHPVNSMPNYGADMAIELGDAALMVLTDQVTDELLISFVQLGIDFHAHYRAGARWHGKGGHASGRKWPILFAGIMLDDADMMGISPAYQHTHFGEDDQTFIGATTATYPDGKPLFGTLCQDTDPANGLSGQHCGDVGAADCRDPDGVRDACSYRECCTSYTWVSHGLAAMMMGAEDIWNWDPFFAYVDRWAEEGNPTSEAPQKTFGSRRGRKFVYNMWRAYRADLP